MTKEQYDFIMKRAELDITEQMKVAKEVSDDVKARGDEAVLEYTAKFDRVQLTADKMKVTPEEIEAGYNNLDKETREAIEYAYTISMKSNFRRKCGLLWSMTDLW
jgi:histidinol dehydrogenase